MAAPPANSFLYFFLFLSAAVAGAAIAAGLPKEKMTHLHFYFHDVRAGSGATSLVVTTLNRTTGSSEFGAIGVFDNALTRGPKLTSKRVGRGQGMVIDVALSGHAIMTTLNFVFTEGKHNGSSLALYGRADLTSPAPTERTIIGGSGKFRLARGFSLGKILKASPEYVLAEFDIYVIHY